MSATPMHSTPMHRAHGSRVSFIVALVSGAAAVTMAALAMIVLSGAGL